MKTIEEINKINENKTQLERSCETLLHRLNSNNIIENSNISFNEKNSIKFFMSKIESELKKLEQSHLNK